MKRYVSKENTVRIVEIGDKHELSYYFLRPSPILISDGHQAEIDKALIEKKWGVGMGGMTYKRNVSLTELLECIAYSTAYLEVTDFLTNSDPFTKVPYTVSQFLDLVDAKFKVGSKHSDLLKGANLQNLEQVLENVGLVLVNH